MSRHLLYIPQKPLSGDLTLIQIRFPIIKELSPFIFGSVPLMG